MALATTCPHCQTSFKVVADQLKLRRGLVRCGKCQEVFSGVDYLRYIEEPRLRAPAAPAVPAPGPELEDLKTAFFLPETVFNDPSKSDPVTIQAPIAAYIPTPEKVPSADGSVSDFKSPSTELVSKKPEEKLASSVPQHDIASLAERPERPSGLEEGAFLLDQDAEQLQREEIVWRDQFSSTEHLDAYSAVEAAAQKLSHLPQGLDVEAKPFSRDVLQSEATSNAAFGPSPFADDQAIAHPSEVAAIDYSADRPARRLGWAIVLVLLLALALLQGVIVARNELAVQFPDWRPSLTRLAEPLGLKVELPRRFEALTIESFELQASEPAVGDVQIYFAQALLRNTANHAVQWPAIELSLSDPSGQLLARKVLTASDYLSANEPKELGFAGRSEKTFRIRLALNQLTPNGYAAVLFYP
jgi:predicted Zn finger-like uncharacterized protein